MPPVDDKTRRPYLAHILHVDFATFEVRDLLSARQATGLGESGSRVYFDTPSGLTAVDTKTGAITEFEFRIEMLAKRGDSWLVQTDGKLARFDAARGRIERRYPTAPAIPNNRRRGTQWDGGRFVVRQSGFFDTNGKPILALDYGAVSLITEELRICDLETGNEHVIRRRIQATGGSGSA